MPVRSSPQNSSRLLGVSRPPSRRKSSQALITNPAPPASEAATAAAAAPASDTGQRGRKLVTIAQAAATKKTCRSTNHSHDGLKERTASAKTCAAKKAYA